MVYHVDSHVASCSMETHMVNHEVGDWCRTPQLGDLGHLTSATLDTSPRHPRTPHLGTLVGHLTSDWYHENMNTSVLNLFCLLL